MVVISEGWDNGGAIHLFVFLFFYYFFIFYFFNFMTIIELIFNKRVIWKFSTFF